jgi:hypothetical protein
MGAIGYYNNDLEARSERSNSIVVGNFADIAVEASTVVAHPNYLDLQNKEIVLEGTHDKS